MAPSRKNKKEDGKGSSQGSGETSETTPKTGTTSTTADDQGLDLTSDSEDRYIVWESIFSTKDLVQLYELSLRLIRLFLKTTI